MKNTALILSGILFGLIAIVHVLRYLNGWEIVIAHHTVSLPVSLYAAMVSGVLAIFMFIAAARK